MTASAHRVALALAGLVLAASSATAAPNNCLSPLTTSWTCFGGNIHNHRSAVVLDPVTISPTVKFRVDTGASDVSCTPTVVDGFAYFGDWSGFLYKVLVSSGKIIWKKNVTELVWPKGVGATNQLIIRSTPAYSATTKTLVVGTLNPTRPGNPLGTQAFLLSLSVSTGKVVWKYDASQGSPYAVLTASPTVHEGNVYASTSSSEEAVAAYGLPCCRFRGSVFSVRLADGSPRWTFYTVPDNGGSYDEWSGNAVWGSAPSVDALRGLVYVTTGNNYEAPDSAIQCLENNSGNPAAQAKCVDVDGNWFNSVLAINSTTGALAWGRRMSFFDVWTYSCAINMGNPCPFPESPDYDFGQSPLYFPGTKCGDTVRDIIVVAQKSGGAYGLDASKPEAGGDAPFRLIWSAFTGAGGIAGGSQWGSASDGKRFVYLQNSNSYLLNVTLTRPALGNPKWTKGGFATAVDICTGEIMWQAVASNKSDEQISLTGPPTYVRSLIDGSAYVFYPTMSSDGRILVLRAETGEVHTVFTAGPGSIISGPAVVNGVLYVGAGYNLFGTHTPKYGFSAFDLSQSSATPTTPTTGGGSGGW